MINIFKVAKVMEVKARRGVLLQFPSRENSTPQVPRERCPECAKLESRVDAAIDPLRGRVLRAAPAPLSSAERALSRGAAEQGALHAAVAADEDAGGTRFAQHRGTGLHGAPPTSGLTC